MNNAVAEYRQEQHVKLTNMGIVGRVAAREAELWQRGQRIEPRHNVVFRIIKWETIGGSIEIHRGGELLVCAYSVHARGCAKRGKV